MTFIVPSPFLVGRDVRQQGYRARALDGVSERALVPRATAGDTARDDLAALGHEAAQTAHVLVVDDVDLVRAELADFPPAEPATLDGFRCGRNGAPPLDVRPTARQNGTSSSPPPPAFAVSSAKAGAVAGALPATAPLARLMNCTRSATTSVAVRFWPSLPSQSRVCSRPSTKTWLPLSRYSPHDSACLPQTTTVRKHASSRFSPDWVV